MQTEIRSEIVDKAMLLVDLEHAGVTDVTGEAIFTFFDAEPIVKPAKKRKLQAVTPQVVTAQAVSQEMSVSQTGVPQATTPQLPASQTPQQSQKQQANIAINSEDYIWAVAGGDKALIVIGTNAPKGANPLTESENILFTKMLACIDLTVDDISFVALREQDDNGKNIIKNNEIALKKLLEDIIGKQKALHVLLVGVEVCALLSGKELSQARKLEKFTICDKKAGALHHPKILLKQPAFKRAAWRGLLKFKQLLEF